MHHHCNVHVELKCGAPICCSTFNVQSKCRRHINHSNDCMYLIIPGTVKNSYYIDPEGTRAYRGGLKEERSSIKYQMKQAKQAERRALVEKSPCNAVLPHFKVVIYDEIIMNIKWMKIARFHNFMLDSFRRIYVWKT